MSGTLTPSIISDVCDIPTIRRMEKCVHPREGLEAGASVQQQVSLAQVASFLDTLHLGQDGSLCFKPPASVQIQNKIRN